MWGKFLNELIIQQFTLGGENSNFLNFLRFKFNNT